MWHIHTSFHFGFQCLVSACSWSSQHCCVWRALVKLMEEAIQRLQQLQGGWFAIYWGFIPLMFYPAYSGDKDLGYLDLEAIKE